MADLVDELEKRYNATKLDVNLIDIRNKNHDMYYKLDVEFLKNVDLKYKNLANHILNEYSGVNANHILICNKSESVKLNSYLKKIDTKINELKKVVRKDLNTVIDYVDRLADKIDVSMITKDTPLGILIINKYNSLIMYSANLDMSDLNDAMKRQSKRLMYLKELDYLIINYKNINSKYNQENTSALINNLYEIIGKYLHLLTNNEFEYTKEAIKHILAYKFDFIDKYIPTYKIILTKIWNSDLTDDYYFVCSLNLDENTIFLMNKNNIDKYDHSGYICDIPKNFINYFKLSNMDVINYPLPCNLSERCEIGKKNDVNLRAMYTTKDKIDFDSILPIIYLNKNNNH